MYRVGEYENETVAPRPAIIMLDLNLPGTDGREVLTILKQDRDLRAIPVVIFSTSSNPKDIESCYCQGACGYIVKPMDFNKLQQLVNTFLTYWFEVVELPDR